MEVLPQWRARDAAYELVGQHADGDAVVGEGAARQPERTLRGQAGGKLGVAVQLVVGVAPVHAQKPSLMAEQLADGHSCLAPLGEFGPVRGNRLVEIEHAVADQAGHGQRSRALRAREHGQQVVETEDRSPGDVDHGAAAVRGAQRTRVGGVEFRQLFEQGPDRLERRVDRPPHVRCLPLVASIRRHPSTA